MEVGMCCGGAEREVGGEGGDGGNILSAMIGWGIWLLIQRGLRSGRG
jgi:hypothetical protein